jgi:sarcosine oxidase subunit beta
MSNPDEAPGEALGFDQDYYRLMADRMATLLPATAEVALRKSWAATIDFTPDHLPILGPLLVDGRPVGGTVVAAAGGHGMMWGPAVARVAADLATTGHTEVVDVSDLGLDRFDEAGRSRLDADPIALPFPTHADTSTG